MGWVPDLPAFFGEVRGLVRQGWEPARVRYGRARDDQSWL